MTEPRLLLSGLAIGESPRWHDGKLWFCNWCTQEVATVDLSGAKAVVTQVPTSFPFSIDWLPDGRMLVVSGREKLVLRLEPDGRLVTHADLSAIGEIFNEIVVDGRGNAYVNGADLIVLLPADGGTPRLVAEGLKFGNGMAVTADNSTLIAAESHGKCLSAYDIAPDGSLSAGRIWAEVDGPPDGICIDAEGAVWYADVPNKHCVRVAEGGQVLQTVSADQGCFACMLGGPDGTTLFMLAAQWRGMENIDPDARTGQVLVAEAPSPHAGWPASSFSNQ
jgi:sugar lactone lactonase YvrE